jgi:ubiquinone/menaquinone biosynthesis C-methylase UbiE
MYYTNLLKINRHDKVLEIGPGNAPFWRSDVLADKFDANDEVIPGTFGGGKHKTKGKPFFKIHDNRLPFEAEQFDLVICSHVLEHVPFRELDVLVNEIFRVAPKAYIEFPAPLYEVIFDFPVHLNFLFIEENTIYCLPKKYCSISTYQEYFRVLLKVGVFSQSRIHKHFYTIGKEFHRDNFQLEIMQEEKKFFQLLAGNNYKPKLPTLRNKLYHKVRSILN